MVESIKLILVSFIASVGFGIIFHIKKELLPWAGLGGALTRCIYLILLVYIDERLIYSLLAAMAAALYAEIMAMEFRTPSTVFLYPAIIPLIPGDLIYQAAVNFILQDLKTMQTYAADCALTLLGMCLGFVIISTFTYYRRVYSFGKELASHIMHDDHKKKNS